MPNFAIIEGNTSRQGKNWWQLLKVQKGRESAFKVLKISLILVAVSIPLHNNINSWAIVFFCTAALVSSFSTLRHFRIPAVFVIGFTYVSWLALTYFWDVTGGVTIKNLEHYAGFIVLPFALWMIPRLSVKNIWQICFAFLISITVVSFICLVRSWLEYKSTGDTRVFFYHYLSEQMNLNAIFLSNYCVSGICWMLYFRFKYAPAPPMPGKAWVILWCAYLFVFVFLLSSKLVILLMLVFLTFFLIYLGKKAHRLRLSVIILVAVAGAAILAVNNFYYLRWRLSVTEFKQYEGEIDNQNGFAARLMMWQSTAELVQQRPLAGYGVKGAGTELFKKYEEKKFNLGIERKYNSHNQYLQTALMSGLVGLGIFLTFLMLLWVRALRSNNILLTILLLHFMCVSIVESTLEVQQELVFFLFFMLLFYFHLARRTDPKL
jgi:O-antigen ligase